MKFYSEKTHKLYDTQADLIKAEGLLDKMQAEKLAKEKAAKEQRAIRAKAVESAIKEAREANAKANELLNNFVHDYGSFHTSFSTENTFKRDTAIDSFINQVFAFLGEG